MALSDRRRLTSSPAARSLVIALVGAVARFIRGVLVARALGPVGRGQVSTLLGIAEPVALGLGGGAGLAAGQRVRAGTLSAQAAAGVVIRQAILASGVMGVIVLSGLFLWEPLRSDWGIAVSVGGIVVLSVFANGFRNVLRALREIERSFSAELVGAVVSLLLIIVLWFAEITSVVLVLGAMGCGSAVSVIVLSLSKSFSGVRLRKHERTRSLRLMPALLFRYGTNRLDQVVLASIAGFSSAGLYTVAVSVNQAFSQTSQVLAAKAFGECEPNQTSAWSDILRVLRQVWWWIGLLALAHVAIIPWAIPLLFGREYSGAVGPALILVPGGMLLVFANVSVQIAIAHGESEVAGIAEFVGFSANMFGILIAGKTLGASGAAVAADVAYALRALVVVILVRRIATGSDCS